jgi:hypothetical protein
MILCFEDMIGSNVALHHMIASKVLIVSISVELASFSSQLLL